MRDLIGDNHTVTHPKVIRFARHLKPEPPTLDKGGLHVHVIVQLALRPFIKAEGNDH